MARKQLFVASLRHSHANDEANLAAIALADDMAGVDGSDDNDADDDSDGDDGDSDDDDDSDDSNSNNDDDVPRVGDGDDGGSVRFYGRCVLFGVYEK